MRHYYVYIVECSNRTLYTGSTKNIERRIQEDNNGKDGAKSARGPRPVELIYRERCVNLSEALKRESLIKKLSRKQKLSLVKKQMRQYSREYMKIHDNLMRKPFIVIYKNRNFVYQTISGQTKTASCYT